MNTKQIMWAVGVLIVLVVVFGVLTSFTKPTSIVKPAEQHALAGTLQDNGDYVFDESTDTYEIKAQWPGTIALPTADASAKARLVIEQDIADRIATFKSESIAGIDSQETAHLKELGTKYALGFEYKHYSSPGYESYWYTVYEDTGGAHPNSYFFTHVFDAQGNDVKLADMLKDNPNWLDDLAALVRKDVVAQYKTRAEVSDTTGLIFDEGLAAKEENFSNWYLDGTDLVIEIPPYQVAAYVAGSFEVRVPLADVNN
ncbi:MAG TPA: DUF3298 domain-containing protein [Candidatus Paceibacterota bacterium]|jgi:hypothetical protein|nr:DUF3298 domain-containing protein [Candidatus Paceibacterota bacterium]